MILNATGWDRLARGSLNLVVNDSVIDELGRLEPKLEEAATAIAYRRSPKLAG
jgi:hypothetical protein